MGSERAQTAADAGATPTTPTPAEAGMMATVRLDVGTPATGQTPGVRPDAVMRGMRMPPTVAAATTTTNSCSCH